MPEELQAHKSDKGPLNADLLVWVPEGAQQLRALLIIPANSDSKHFGEHAALRAVATKHAMAIVYLRVDTGVEGEGDAPAPRRVQTLLDYVADNSGIKEFRYAP